MKKVCQFCMNKFETEEKNKKTCPDCEFETEIIRRKYARIKEIEEQKRGKK